MGSNVKGFASGKVGDDREEPVRILRDGEQVATVEDANAAFTWILRHQGQSVDYALKYGGYRVLDQDGNAPLSCGDCPPQELKVKPVTNVEIVTHAIEDAYDTLKFEVAGPEVFQQLAQVAVNALGRRGNSR